MLSKIIVCITGMPGAGKSTIVNKLQEIGFTKFTLGDGIRAEAKRRNVDPSGENLGKIMLEVREKNGPGAVAELIKDSIQNSTQDVVIIDGVRSVAEIDVLKQIGDVKLLAIDASPETRFNFLSSRGRSDDPKTQENFQERDNREISVGLDKSIEIADKTITNRNLTIDELVNSAKEIIEGWTN
jgi:dephospho-CoA kinase|tara:strand:- start:621 stop:1172 length:552 start_codon:yes stop_codon:yes gene_type:complete